MVNVKSQRLNVAGAVLYTLWQQIQKRNRTATLDAGLDGQPVPCQLLLEEYAPSITCTMCMSSAHVLDLHVAS